MPDHYQLLNVSPTASAEQIQSAYHRERARLLADAGEDESRVAPALQALEQAYAVLSDPGQRAAYDQARGLNTDRALVVGDQSSALQTTTAQAPRLEERLCPKCGRPNPIQATMCAYCAEQISRPCPKCGNPAIVDERVCGRCGTVIAEYDQQRFMQAEARKRQIEAERIAADARVEKLEQSHGKNRVFGAVFWAFVLGLCIGVCALGGFLVFVSGR